MKHLIFLLVLMIFVPVHRSFGQISYGGTPASFNTLKSLRSELPVMEMARVSNAELMRQDALSKDPYKKYTFARSFDVDISPSNSGVWDQANGMKIWRVAIRSVGAYSLNVLFDRFIVPTGASLFIYTPDHRILRGAFNANNEQSSGVLPIYPLAGDEIIVEYNEPADVSVNGEIHISKVNHDYKNAIGDRPLGESGNCNLDVYCKEALVMSAEKQAVVQLVISGTDLCTGTLVNNTNRDKTPYLLTAGHCIQRASDAQQTVFTFNYESPYCGQNGSANGYVDQTMTGSILRARSDSLDFALVELEMIPPPDYRPYYAGWDRSKTTPPLSRTVHHPLADVKKVSVDSDAPGIATYNSTGHVPNSFWWIKKWNYGTTEAGSSGGPLFSDANLVIGTLTGGTATCELSTDDYFSMFAFQWNHSSLIARQLKKWLDPANTGLARLEPIDPYLTADKCDQISDVKQDDKYLTSRITNGKGYVSGHNSLKINGYAQMFDQTDETTLSAFSVGFGKSVTGVSNGNSVVNFQIYQVDESTGLPGATLQTVQVPIKSIKSKYMHFVELSQPLTITGRYFIGFDINYSNYSDTVAAYHAPARETSDQNKAYCKLDNTWQPFYWVPEIGIKTSLLINSYGCGTTFAEVTPEPLPESDPRFKIYYPNDESLDILYLKNTGKEEFGRVIFYDILGRKISETERMLTTEPMELSCAQLRSGVYCIAVETIDDKEIMKVKVIRTR